MMVILPIKWKLARTISGVSKRGGGPIEGRTKHVLLLEDWEHRKYGEFLCGAKIVNPLAHRIYNIEDSWSEKGSITCKKCLALVERMNKH